MGGCENSCNCAASCYVRCKLALGLAKATSHVSTHVEVQMASTSSPPDITDAVADLSISPGLANVTEVDGDITYLPYDGEHYLQPLVDLISVELSEHRQ